MKSQHDLDMEFIERIKNTGDLYVLEAELGLLESRYICCWKRVVILRRIAFLKGEPMQWARQEAEKFSEYRQMWWLK